MARAYARPTQAALGVVMCDHVTNYSKGNTEPARMMTPFLASNWFRSIRSNSTTSFCPSLNVQAHCATALFDGLDTARAPRLDRGSLPIGALNFVKVHNADGLLCLVLNFLVAVRHKLDDDHTTARQELFNCDVLFHSFSFGMITRQVTPRPAPLIFTTISPSVVPSRALDKTGGVARKCTTGWPHPS